jgi:hypothetical protein
LGEKENIIDREEKVTCPDERVADPEGLVPSQPPDRRCEYRKAADFVTVKPYHKSKQSQEILTFICVISLPPSKRYVISLELKDAFTRSL